MAVQIDTFVVGPFLTNTFAIRDGDACAVVDPGIGADEVVDFCRDTQPPEMILLTHGHGDHIGGVIQFDSAFPGVRLVCPAGDAAMLADPRLNLSAPFGLSLTIREPDRLVRPGEDITIGRSVWRVLDTSGHTPGGVSYYCPEEGVVIAGDALFRDSIGRTDFPGGDADTLLANIASALMSLPDDTRVLPGHGSATTVGRERKMNMFLRRP